MCIRDRSESIAYINNYEQTKVEIERKNQERIRREEEERIRREEREKIAAELKAEEEKQELLRACLLYTSRCV